MSTWLRRVRGALGTGLIWAAAWAPAAVLVSLLVDPSGSMDEPWLLIGAIPGFLGGVAFSAVLGIAARHRRLRELSVARVGAWGALAGLLVGVLPFFLVTPNPAIVPWLLRAVVIGPITLLSAGSAAASLAIAKRAEGRALLDAGADDEAVGLADPSRARP